MQAGREQISDAEMIRATARGDEMQFAALYDRYGAILFGLLMRILGDRAEAEDTLQDVFLQVWQKAGAFNEERGTAFTWLVTLARSRAIDRLRSRNVRQRVSLEALRAGDDQNRAAATDAADQAILSEQSDIVHQALLEIPEEQRRTLLLAYFEGLSQTEIAERTGDPLGTVKTRARAGLKKLRELLRGKDEQIH
jgi:RNA polymerase sigma-70 factor, ECF subfamily